MNRTITGFHQDDKDDWVAELTCHHGQHVRHRPPIWPRAWATTGAGRAERLGASLDCPLCDRCEVPDGLVVVRTAGPFDADTLPDGLRRTHRLAEGTWARLRVLEGEVELVLDTTPPTTAQLAAVDEQVIPPSVPHRLRVLGPTRLELDFLAPEAGP